MQVVELEFGIILGAERREILGTWRREAPSRTSPGQITAPLLRSPVPNLLLVPSGPSTLLIGRQK